jgi:hypothetical protein
MSVMNFRRLMSRPSAEIYSLPHSNAVAVANLAANVSDCVGFRSPAYRDYPRGDAAGDRKAPRHEIAVGDAAAVPASAMGN